MPPAANGSTTSDLAERDTGDASSEEGVSECWVLLEVGVDDAEEVEISKTFVRALRLRPLSVDLESRLVVSIDESAASVSAIGDEGIQNELEVIPPDERREEAEVRLERIDGACVDVDSRGRTLSPLETVDVERRLALVGALELKRIGGRARSLFEVALLEVELRGARTVWEGAVIF